MKIAYIAKHGCGGNDDEGAIHHALEALGHEVLRLREHRGRAGYRLKADFLLFHKWEDTVAISKMNMPRVFWYFDLIDYPDRSLAGRCRARISWINQVLPLVDLGFCTDGDWVAKDTSGKLVWLPQGADQRYAGRCKPMETLHPILFTGITRGGAERSYFVEFMGRAYGNQFHHIERGVYGVILGRAVASSDLVIAPSGPVTDNYWSNRVYLTLGYGGFLLHPYCEKLTGHYTPDREIVYYRNLKSLRGLIDYYLTAPQERGAIANAGLERTLAEHTYLHRCRSLVDTVRARLKI